MKNQKILITGGSGMLATNWAYFLRSDYDVILGLHSRIIAIENCLSYKLNLQDVDSIRRALVLQSPDVVIHTAGLTSIELCELHPDEANNVNVKLTSNLAQVCEELSICFVYISTDHLFSGDKSYMSENEVVNPLNVYATTKALAEQVVSEIHSSPLIIRTNFYGWGPLYRPSFSDFIINSLRNNKRITLFSDIYYTPILMQSMMGVVHKLLSRNASGIFNVVGDTRISKYDFGLLIANIFGLNGHLIDSSSIDHLNLVQRPKDMSLSNKKVTQFLSESIGSVNEHLELMKSLENQKFIMELKKL